MASGDRENGNLCAGLSRAVITPPVGFPLSGTLRDEVSNDVDGDLTVTAVYVSDGAIASLIIGCDLIRVPAETASEWRREIHTRVGVPGRNVFINVSHTHAVPSTPDWYEYEGVLAPEVAEAVDRYFRNVGEHVVACAAAAAQRAVPARYGIAQGEVRIGVNRREVLPDGTLVLGEDPSGLTDPTVTLVRFDHLSGQPLASLLHYACHPDVLGPKSKLISPDYVGAARATLELVSSCPAVFLQGAAGNIDPRCGIVTGPDGLDAAHRLGRELGCEAARLHQSINTARKRGRRIAWDAHGSPVTAWEYEDSGVPRLRRFRVESRTLQLPLRPLPSRSEAEAVLARYEEELQDVDGWGGVSDRLIAQRNVAWAKVQLDAVKKQQAPMMEFEMQALVIDDWALVTFPAEVFVEIGLQIKSASPIASTMVSGYTNGLYFYVPTARAFDEGGYEVESHRNFLQPSGPTEEWESSLVDAATELLQEIAGPP